MELLFARIQLGLAEHVKLRFCDDAKEELGLL
jgi:hypothetical protein